MRELQQRFFDIRSRKKTNVVVSADVTDRVALFDLVEKVGRSVLGVKLHSDIVAGWCEADAVALRALSRKLDFLIIEDRKFCDIGNTVGLQSGQITRHADLVTVHSIPGPAIVAGLRANCLKNKCGILLIADMSSAGTLIDSTYTARTVDMAERNRDVVVGFICQTRLAEGFLHFAPGVRLEGGSDRLGQQYNTPEFLVADRGIDCLIVGRGIYQSADPAKAAQQYACLDPDRLVRSFRDAGIVQRGEFTLKSGAKSDLYFDLRLLMGRPALFWRVAAELGGLVDGRENTAVVGVPLGAVPMATAVARVLDAPLALLRDKQKKHGRGKTLEGGTVGASCVVVEDVTSTGGSVLGAIARLETLGYKVSQVVVILDRGAGGLDRIRAQGYRVDALLTAAQFKVANAR
uniref:Uridine 5'-monophosphate synthase n=1 Tax=Marseillevirus LCMAC103 TaxID=2506604 RepID=A0A481YUM7_9VIRU|nr:MAG: phosphoribosyl transferase [Marseillevirus LCMAC103]